MENVWPAPQQVRQGIQGRRPLQCSEPMFTSTLLTQVGSTDRSSYPGNNFMMPHVLGLIHTKVGRAKTHSPWWFVHIKSRSLKVKPWVWDCMVGKNVSHPDVWGTGCCGAHRHSESRAHPESHLCKDAAVGTRAESARATREFSDPCASQISALMRGI